MENIRKHVQAAPSDLERFVCEGNIARYQKLLSERRDEGQRRTIAKLLSDEEAKLRSQS
jgi:hypothetical protein